MDQYALTTNGYDFLEADHVQAYTERAARAPEPHGEEADEGIHERMCCAGGLHAISS